MLLWKTIINYMHLLQKAKLQCSLWWITFCVLGLLWWLRLEGLKWLEGWWCHPQGFWGDTRIFSCKLKMHTLGEQAGNTKEISPAYGLYGYHILLSGVVRKMTWEHITWKRVHYVSKSFLVNQQFCSHEMCLTQTQFILKTCLTKELVCSTQKPCECDVCQLKRW